MRLAYLLNLFVLALLPVLSTTNALAKAPPPEPPRLSPSKLQALLPSLQRGGYIIYFRHMSSDHLLEDQHPVDLTNCKTQRPLSAKGRQQARAVGQAFRRLKIPLGKVFSSPFCRCRDTARLAFGKSKSSDALYFAMGLDRQAKQEKGRALRQMLARVPASGRNTVIVAHTANLQEAVGLWPKPEGAAYIFKPQGNGTFKAIASLDPDTWIRIDH